MYLEDKDANYKRKKALANKIDALQLNRLSELTTAVGTLYDKRALAKGESTENSNITVESVKTINSNENNLYEITLLVESKEKLNKYINDLMMLSNILSVERLLK